MRQQPNDKKTNTDDISGFPVIKLYFVLESTKFVLDIKSWPTSHNLFKHDCSTQTKKSTFLFLHKFCTPITESSLWPTAQGSPS